MNRQAAMGELNDRISGDSSGDEAWSRRTESNNSLNPTRVEHLFDRQLGRSCVVCARVNSSVRRQNVE
jgi:hypothetical protein